MPSETLSKQSTDLLQQLQASGVSISTTSAGSLDTLKENSQIANATLDLLSKFDESRPSFGHGFDSSPSFGHGFNSSPSFIK